jgi:hypothetical protein
MESVDPVHLKDVNKGFSKPSDYAAVLERLAKRNVYAITSFIFGMDNDTPGVAERTLQQVRTWPPGLPIFGLLTPLPATPLYKRLEVRRTAHAPAALAGFRSLHNGAHSAEDDDRRSACRTELGWAHSYSPEALAQAVAALDDQHVGDRVNVFLARLCFRGIYFPMLTKFSWLRVVVENRRTILRLFKEGVSRWMLPRNSASQDSIDVATPDAGEANA